MQYQLPFTIVPGHQIASGQAKNSPYPKGSIELQAPYFEKLGLNLSAFYFATLNLQLSVAKINWQRFDYEFDDVLWLEKFPAECFAFIHCQLEINQQTTKALVYHVKQESKIDHFQPDNVVEVLAPKLDGVSYGQQGTLIIPANYCQLTQ